MRGIPLRGVPQPGLLAHVHFLIRRHFAAVEEAADRAARRPKAAENRGHDRLVDEDSRAGIRVGERPRRYSEKKREQKCGAHGSNSDLHPIGRCKSRGSSPLEHIASYPALFDRYLRYICGGTEVRGGATAQRFC